VCAFSVACAVRVTELIGVHAKTTRLAELAKVFANVQREAHLAEIARLRAAQRFDIPRLISVMKDVLSATYTDSVPNSSDKALMLVDALLTLSSVQVKHRILKAIFGSLGEQLQTRFVEAALSSQQKGSLLQCLLESCRHQPDQILAFFHAEPPRSVH
jgi:hypothetical protein